PDDVDRVSGDRGAPDDPSLSGSPPGLGPAGSLPLRDGAVSEDAMRCVRPADVEEAGEDRVLGTAPDDALLVRGADAAFRCREKTRSHHHALGAEGEGGRGAAAVRDPAGGDHRDRPYRLDD